jgi:hypothetical protein
MITNTRYSEIPFYRPYRWASADFQLGLRPMDPKQWILMDVSHGKNMRDKRQRLRSFPQIYYRSLPNSLAAQQELCELVGAHLLADHPQYFERSGSAIRSRVTDAAFEASDRRTEPLLQLSSLIEEDFMLIEQLAEGPRITAASNTYSSSGRLVASVGRDVDWAHQTVPRLTDQLGPKINRVLDSVHDATPCERFNWQITPMATIFFPHDDPHAANAAAMRSVSEALSRDAGQAGQLLWMRVERQTLRRLPTSRAVAFSLHTYSDPLASLESDQASIRAILALLRAYSAERWHYSEMHIIREPILAWLESRS